MRKGQDEDQWWSVGGKPRFYSLQKWLAKNGFGQFRVGSSRTSDTEYFQNDHGVLKTHDPQSIKRWVQTKLEARRDEPDRDSILERWMEVTASTLDNKALKSLPIYSEDGTADSIKLPLFDDNDSQAHVHFRNRIVRVSKNGPMEFKPYGRSASARGAVWESAIIQHDIEVLSEEASCGLFEQFARCAMYRKIENATKSSNWRKNYEFNAAAVSHYEAMRRAYGFLIHTHNTADFSKCIYFVDAESGARKAEGGTGKSLIMRSIERYKKLVPQDGRQFRIGMDKGGGRFQFANVTMDTKVVMIDDIYPQFRFDMLFSMITGAMEIERKGRDKFVIPANKKPKFGITTNYVIPQGGASHKRRQLVIEFGSYWYACFKAKEKVSDKKNLGKMLFQEFDEKDWNEFYNFGLRCVRDYLRDGLAEPAFSTMEAKALRQEIEGDQDDGFVDWLEDWIAHGRIQGGFDKGNGITVEELRNKFIETNPDCESRWDESRFKKGLWNYCQEKPDTHYNRHLSGKGDSRTARRWLRGAAGKQREHVVITTDSDLATALEVS